MVAFCIGMVMWDLCGNQSFYSFIFRPQFAAVVFLLTYVLACSYARRFQFLLFKGQYTQLNSALSLGTYLFFGQLVSKILFIYSFLHFFFS